MILHHLNDYIYIRSGFIYVGLHWKEFGRDFLIYSCNKSYSQAFLFCDSTLNLPLIASLLLGLWLVLSLPGLDYLNIS